MGPGACALLALLFVLSACRKAPEREDWPDVPVTEERVSVMTFNVENLFDTKDDPGKEDETYLPLSAKRSARHKDRCMELKSPFRREQCLHLDWSERTLELKLRRVAGVVLQDGRGPDVLVLQEVENAGVLERLRREHLGPAGYQAAFLVEGGDVRGIDQAILSRLDPLGEPKLRRSKNPRGVLEASFKMPDGTPLTVFAVHLPAPYRPRRFRAGELEELDRLLERVPEGHVAVAAGDFNVSSEEEAGWGLIEHHAASHWLVSHRIGCGGCRGTYYYRPRKEWSFMDVILLSKNLHPRGDSDWTVLRDSVRVPAGKPYQRGEDGTPARFDAKFGEGVSDHWPVYLELARKRRLP